jgi:hypothetical protein
MHQCGILAKVLQFEIQRYKKQDIAYIENDMIGCYDRIVNPVVLLFLRRLGVPLSTIRALSSTWEQTTHRIKTLYGVSQASYSNTLEYFLFGPGQASTIGPILWLICFLLIYRSVMPGTTGMVFTSTNNSHTVNSKGTAFVDDTGLGCTNPPQSKDTSEGDTPLVVTKLQYLAQQWECLLFSTGGALNLNKCFWFLLS